MGLIGRLEDLPVSDIIQIVFLSRRTGVLELKRASHIYRIYFIKGCLVLAEKDSHVTIDELLHESSIEINSEHLAQARTLHAAMPERGLGDILLEMNICSPQDLAKTIFSAIQNRIYEILENEEGDFSFELKEKITPAEIGYTPDGLFKQTGIPPDKILTKSGEIGIIKEIRDTLIRGKEVFKSAAQGVSSTRGEVHAPDEPIPAAVEPAIEPDPISLSEPLSESGEPAPAEPSPTIMVERETALIPTEIDIKFKPKDEKVKLLGKFSLLSKDQEAGADLGFSCFILEGDPLLRVTLKRIFSKGGFKVFHYNQSSSFMQKIQDITATGEPVILILGISNTIPAAEVENCIETLTSAEGFQPPVIVIHPGGDPREHHSSFRSGADMVMVRPDLTTLSVKVSEEVLNTFVEDIFISVKRYVKRLPEFTEKKEFHDIAAKEKLNRSLTLLKGLIFELANPEDKTQVGLMTLRMAAEYLERGIILLTRGEHFVGIGGFGETGDDVPMNIRVRSIEIPIEEESIFNQVHESLKTHKGKLRRTKINEYFLNRIGKIFPNEVVLFPIAVKGKLIGILYGDNAEYKRPIGNTDGLEIFLSQAGYAFEDIVQHLNSRGSS